ncbi:MAG: hypothetical protein KC433_16555 [Anaerolineales bacterium]|nr:hypothetical protein [Anaerolineales bacterium]MCB8939284.1 hypothetical protein [Ardenticatenaceae bacterium]
MVRFVNSSGSVVTASWRDTSQSPAQLIPYFQIYENETADQETFSTHEWVITDTNNNVLFEYTVQTTASNVW